MSRLATASVCILTYNSESDIQRCLQAVLKQSYPVERIIVVDNASSDQTCRIVRTFGEKVQLIVNTVNSGFAPGQNQAISHTESDYVLVLNPDVVISPNYIALQVEWMERHPKVGSTTGQLVLASNPAVMDSAGIDMTAARKAWDLGGGENVGNWQQSGEIFGVSGAAPVYARRMIEDVRIEGQFFDESYFAYKEDVDVAWRARLLGWQSYYIAEAKAIHERGWKYEGRKSRKQVPLFLRRHSYQNRIYTIIKNEPINWHLPITAARLLALELIQIGYITLFEPQLLKCWATITLSLPRLLRQRKLLQRRIHERKGKH
jgi:GT2 family glycosyltransferase